MDQSLVKLDSLIRLMVKLDKQLMLEPYHRL
jgi:hypothetical protein